MFTATVVITGQGKTEDEALTDLIRSLHEEARHIEFDSGGADFVAIEENPDELE